MDFWNAFCFKHFCLTSDEVINIQQWELTDDRASSSLQDQPKTRGEYIREIRNFESFYNCKYNYRDQDEMRRRMEQIKAELIWEHHLRSYATYLQTCTSYPEVIDLDVCSCSYLDRSLEFPTAPFSIASPTVSKLRLQSKVSFTGSFVGDPITVLWKVRPSSSYAHSFINWSGSCYFVHFHFLTSRVLFFTMFLSDAIEKPIEVPEGELKKEKAKTQHRSSKKSPSKSASEIAKAMKIQDLTVPPAKAPIQVDSSSKGDPSVPAETHTKEDTSKLSVEVSTPMSPKKLATPPPETSAPQAFDQVRFCLMNKVYLFWVMF